MANEWKGVKEREKSNSLWLGDRTGRFERERNAADQSSHGARFQSFECKNCL
jgi:hypothetical protein